MIRYRILKLFLVFLFVACSRNENYKVIKYLDYSPSLSAQKYPVENAGILNAQEIININDEYILISDEDDEAILKIFSLPDLRYQYSWGTEGRGPDEFPYIPLDKIQSYEDKIVLNEIGKRELRTYTVNDSTLLRENVESLSHNNQEGPLADITFVTSDLYVAENGMVATDLENEFVALEPNNDSIKFLFGEFPETELRGYEKLFEFVKTTESSPNGTKIAAFYLNHNLIAFYDNEGNLINRFKVEEQHNFIKNREEGENYRYRKLLKTSNQYLYSLGYYNEREYINENIESFQTTFEVWKWTGDLVFKAKFDTPIHNFTVSEKYGKIYAYSVLDMSNIYVFDLPDL